MSTKFRMTSLGAWGGGALELTEIQLWAGGVRVDTSGTVLSTIAPESGDVSFLSDGTTAHVVRWSASAVSAASFALEWELAGSINIDAIHIGAADAQSTFAKHLIFQKLEGGLWKTIASAEAAAYPGARTLTATAQTVVWSMNFNAGLAEDSGRTFSVQGAPVVQSAAPLLDGSPYLSFNGSSGALVVPNSPGFNLGTEWSISFDLRTNTSSTGGSIWHHGRYVTTSQAWVNQGVSIRVLDATVRAYFYATSLSTEQYLDGATTVGVAQHWDVIRRGNTGELWRNGVLVASRSDLNEFAGPPTVDVEIGRWTFNAAAPVLNGALDNLVVARGGGLVPSVIGYFEARQAAQSQKISAGATMETQALVTAATQCRDMECGGQGSIYGTVELYAQAGNIPLPRRVRLHRSRDGLLVRETWSDAQGNYRFDGITDRYKYDVIAWDHEGLQQSVVANDLMPEVMP